MTNELEREILRVLEANDYGLSVYANPGADGISRAEIDEPLRAPLRQAEPQSLEKTMQDIPAVAGGIAGGVGVGLGEAADLGIGLLEGAYKAINPGAEEGRFQSFVSGLAEQFETGYGEQARSVVMDMGKRAGLSPEQLDVMDESITAGSMLSIGGAAKKAAQAVPGVMSKAGDVIEGAGEGAKARMAEGGVTLGAGVDPDPLIAAAGDAVAKFRAPTEKEPGIIAFHGSGADFDEFKLEKIGTGEGAQAYGYGLYFADKEDIATYYKNMMQRSVDIDGNPYIRGNNINDELIDPEIADDLGATNGDLEAAIKNSEEFLQEMIADDNVAAIRSTSRELEKLKELRGRITSSDQEGKMYKVGLEPKPEDMLDYQIPIEQQPENIQQTVKKALSYIYPDVKDPALSMRGSDLQNAIINRVAVSRGNIEKMSDPIDADIARIDPNNEKTDAAIAAQIMLEQGIPGMKYRDAGSRGGAKSIKDASFNYVIFDDKMIKILEKYGIVGPVAITGAAASQQEGESDGRSA